MPQANLLVLQLPSPPDPPPAQLPSLENRTGNVRRAHLAEVLEQAVAVCFSSDRRRARATNYELLTKLLEFGDHASAGRLAQQSRWSACDSGNFINQHFWGASVWAGYPKIKVPEVAARRAAQLNRMMPRFESDSQARYQLVEAIFLTWAERWHEALGVLDKIYASKQLAALYVPLTRAWIDLMRGHERDALLVIEAERGKPEPSVAFLAEKMFFEFGIRTKDRQVLQEAWQSLLQFRCQAGLWAPDLRLKARQHGLWSNSSSTQPGSVVDSDR